MGSYANIINKLSHGSPLILIILSGLFIVLASGCGGGSGDNDDGGSVTPQSQVTVAGVVSGSGGLLDVTVSSGGKSATTDVNGFYELANIPVPASGSVVLTYEKEGYATFQRSLPVADGETYAVAASLLQYHHNESMDAAQSNVLIVADPNNVTGHPLAEISFPAGSVASSGTVTVEVAVGDPTTEAGRPTFPGDYMAASTLGGEVDTPLESVVFTEITVTDANGTELTQLNEPATVTVRLPDALQSQYSAGDTIPWWSYDETTATWVREDAKPATTELLDDAQVIDRDGVLYAEAEVTHFSWWNVDVPMDEHACLCVTVKDENSAAVVGSLLVAEGVSYNGRSSPARTDTNGQACVTVKRSTITMTERIKLYIESGGVKFYYDVTGASEGDIGSSEIFTPTTQGSTIRNTGQCVNLGNVIELHLDGVVNGTVTQESSGSPVANFTILSNFGPTVMTNAEGRYSINVPVGVPISLFAVGLISQAVTVASADTPATVNFVVPNQVPVLTPITREPSGTMANGQTATLSVVATDSDGDDLTYAWVATAGNLNQTAGTSVEWTAPTSGSGTAEATVTVTDLKGGQASQTTFIVYNEPVQPGDGLSFVILDARGSDQPVQDIFVTLYNTDNSTIAETRVSNASGVVDFGNIGRTRATFSLVYEDAAGERYINTYVDVLVAQNIVYYLDLDEPTPPIAGINLNLSDIPADADPALFKLEPMGYTGPLTNIPVAQDDLQDDGKLSMLALAYDGDFIDNTLLGYGYLLDQTVSNGASYNIALSRSPANLGWGTSPVTPLNWLFITGNRDDARYAMHNDLTVGGTGSGTLPFPREFPVENFQVMALGNLLTLDDMVLVSLVTHNTLPQFLVITMPDYRIDSFEYSAATRTFNWGIAAGTTPHDTVSLGWTLQSNDDGKDISWSILMPENSTNWPVMALPAQVRTWIDDSANIIDIAGLISVSVSDMSGVSSMDELWQLTISGGPLLAGFQYLYTGTRFLPDAINNSSNSVAQKSLPNTDMQKALQSVDISPGGSALPKGLEHLIRR